MAGKSVSADQKAGDKKPGKVTVSASHIMPRCPACGAPEQLVWVHGHGQCAHCHMNVMPCCDGETCATD